MRTSELAGKVGVNAETLRYYERRGLLNEPPRTSGGYRDYPPTAVDLLRFIKRAQEHHPTRLGRRLTHNPSAGGLGRNCTDRMV